MYGELRSPNVHEPRNLTEYSNTIMNYRDSITSLWAGGTFIMSQSDFYPSNAPNTEIISIRGIEELHHFLRNDRYAEFGAMVSLNEIAYAGKMVLPRILLETINQTACRFVREQITIGGSLCTPHFRSPLASTLLLLDSTVELRYPIRNRLHSKWFPISRIYDKSGNIALPPSALLTKVRIAIQQYDYQFFRSVGSPLKESTSAASLALVAKMDQNSLQSARMVITIPSAGFYTNRDIDNMIASLQLPIDNTRYQTTENFIITSVKENLGGITHLQEARVRGMFHEAITELNQKILSY